MTIRFENTLRISLFTLGFSSLATQVFLIRECFFVLNGNELVIGIVMANWMLLTGVGAFIGRFFGKMKGRIPFLLFLQFLFSLLPMLMLLKLDLWKAVSLPSGSVPGLIPVIRFMFLFQLPFCLLNGFLFVAYVQELSRITGKNASSGSYAIESVGGMFAGLLVNIFILKFSGMFVGLRILLVINLLVCILYSITCAIRSQRIVLIPVFLIFMVLPFFADLDAYTGKLFYPAQKLIFHKNTPYGKLDVTMNAGQLNYFENGLLLFSSNNEIVNEESVHFAMIQHQDPRKILLVSGGISGTVREVLKYHPNRIDYVELDPGLISLGRKYSKILDDKRIHVIHGDARRFVRQTKEKYDVVLVHLPEPSTLLINRFYSSEFLMELRKVLTPGAVICESLPSTSDYVSKTAARTNSTLVQTLKTQFRNVMILPGQRNYFLASDSSLSPEITVLVAGRGITNLYVNSYYLDENSLKERSEYIHSHLDKNAEVNSDFKPVAFFQQLRYWTSMFEWNMLAAGIVILVLLFLVFFSLNRISLGLFTGGFTASSLQLLILISFQIIYGYVFLATGIILALFMAGLALGAFSFNRLIPLPDEKRYIRIQISLALFSLGFPFIILALNLPGMPVMMVYVVFLLLTLILSFITGLEFSLASAIGSKDITLRISSNYSADLFGSAIGAIVTTLILLPILGIVTSCLVLVGMNIFSAGFLFFMQKKL
jgi:spermidine synthase